tara:strand:+ start:465 stop:668 length:204 start_codon:yes stop_codon:yes gene_type:complete
MNKYEQQVIDEATAKAESELIIKQAMDADPQFLHFLLGWMMNHHHKEIAEAAESWIETTNFKLPEGN